MIVLTPFKKALLFLEKALQQPKNEFIRALHYMKNYVDCERGMQKCMLIPSST